MTTHTVTTIEGPLALHREREIELLNEVADTLSELNPEETTDDRRRLRDVAKDLGEMFFLVAVIGEFNSGKSTFINAMLGDSLLPMGITPTTEAIELIRYADEPQRKPTVSEDGRLRQWAHPNTGAPGVAIVDTPGTGSVFKQHDAVAKDFLHRSDLVIFLISSKRAFADTERIYLELARNYGKKTVLVMNQIDLLDPGERAEVRKFIERQVRESLGFEPLIFAVSAKKSLNGEDGGVDAVRAHLRGVLAEAPPAKQKLLTQLGLTEKIIRRYMDAIELDVSRVTEDTTRARNVQEELEKHSLGLDVQFKEANTEIEKVFEDLRKRGHTFIDSNLSVRQILRRPSRDKLQADFQDIVIGRALRDINEATTGYINAVIDSSRLYWRGVIDRLNQLKEMMDQELAGQDASVYSEQRESLQEAIRIAKAELESYSTGRVVGNMQAIFENNMNAFTVSMMAVLGGVIVLAAAIAAPGAALVGASAVVIAVAAPIALVGGGAALRYYRNLQSDTHKDFDERVDQLVKTYRDSLDDLTAKERQRLKQYGNQVLLPVFNRLEIMASRYKDQMTSLEKHLREIERLRTEIGSAVDK
jgi:small GTP-binding protein